LKDCWRIPPQYNGAFAAAREDVLAVYARPYDETRPVVFMDEKPCQLLDHAREPLPVKPGHTEKVDNEYRRNGTRGIFMCTEPLAGWRHGEALSGRTKQDWAHQIKRLLDTRYPEAEKIVPVTDNLNTRALPSLYETFPPARAFRLTQKLEPRFTPKHGSRLDMAEAELSALAARCPGDRRIGDIDTLNTELSAWDTQRNRKQRERTGASPRRMPASNSNGFIRKLLSKYLDVTW
jgi:hypothetical protein